MKSTSELRDSIENLYEVFGAYPLRAHTEACSCCHSPSDEKRVHAKPLRLLTADDLRPYATDALLVWGGADDFKHFLPRVFELLVAHGDEFVDPEVALGKLYYAEWGTWPDVERKSVKRFSSAAWSALLDSEPCEPYGQEMDDWVCGLAQFEPELSPYLKSWLEAETETAGLNLAAFIYTNIPILTPDGYWRDRVESFNEVAMWVRSEAVKKVMKKVAAGFPRYEFVERAYASLP